MSSLLTNSPYLRVFALASAGLCAVFGLNGELSSATTWGGLALVLGLALETLLARWQLTPMLLLLSATTLFLGSRPLLVALGAEDGKLLEMIDVFDPYYFHYAHAYVAAQLFLVNACVLLALVALVGGDTRSAARDLRRPAHETLAVNAWRLGLLLLPFAIWEVMSKLSFAMSNGYVALYTAAYSANPLVTVAAKLSPILFMIVLAYTRDRTLARRAIVITVLLLLIKLATGFRGASAVWVLTLMVYAIHRFSIRINLKYLAPILILLVPVLFQRLVYLRDGSDLRFSIGQLIYLFFQQQGVTYGVLPLTVEYATNHGWGWDSVWAFLSGPANLLSQVYQLAAGNYQTYWGSGNSLELLSVTNSLSAKLTAYLDVEQFLLGRGVGDSVLAGVYVFADGSIFFVSIVLALYYVIMLRLIDFRGTGLPALLAFYIASSLFYSPRADGLSTLPLFFTSFVLLGSLQLLRRTPRSVKSPGSNDTCL